MSLKVWLPLDGSFRNLGPTSLDITNTNVTVDTNGKIGSCYYFNGSAFLSAPSPNDIISVCFWLKANYNSTSSVAFADYKSKIAFGFYNTSQAIVSCNGYSIKTYNHSITNNAWTHIALVKANNDILLYINGELLTSRGSTNYFTHSTNTLMIGKRSTGSNINGYINDVRLYDHILSDAEVRELARGLVLHYKLDNITNGIADSSGYGHNGKILKGPLTIINDLDRYSLGIKFTATNKKIEISNLITSGFGNSYSFAWWAKVNSLSPMHWGFADGIRLNGMYTGRLWNTGDSSSNPLYNPGTTTQVSAPSINTWHYWVMTGNGTKCYVYLDGVLWGEAKTYKAISGSTIYINGWNTSTNYSSNDLSISDFRIYCTALSPDDILELYHTSAKIDNKLNLHTFELVEDSSKISINNKGQTLCDELIEDTTTKFYKGTKIIKTNQLIEI